MALSETFIRPPLTISYPDQRDLPHGSCPTDAVTLSPFPLAFPVPLDVFELGRDRNCILHPKCGHTIDFFRVA